MLKQPKETLPNALILRLYMCQCPEGCDRLGVRRVGAVDYVAKPLDLDYLARAVAAAVRR